MAADTETTQACACETPESVRSGASLRLWLTGLVSSLALWTIVYTHLTSTANWIAYGLLKLEPKSHLGEAVAFFCLDVPKVLLLLALIVFFVGILRSFFSPERTRRLLAGRAEWAGNVLASLLGVATPFCSCSAVPLFIGFVTSGVPLGVTFSFLISAPMVNEIALALLFALFGWKIAGLYLGFGLFIAMLAGWVIGRLKLESWVEEWVYAAELGEGQLEEKLPWARRFDRGLEAVRAIVGRVWVFVILGIAVGAAIHGWVPEDFMASIMGKGAWWSVPLAVVVGVPMYSNAAGIIPVVEALLEKGAALGTVLAFMMSVIALSFPEFVILRKVLKPKLIAVFAAVVGVGILLVGYLFNTMM